MLTATLVRRLRLPSGRRVVAIGGATFGGSGKTPLAIACAASLASRGLRVALIGHAYRASPCRPRVVAPTDALHEVGDEALVAAEALRRCGPPGGPACVVVAQSRREAIAFAASWADALVLDGVAQTRPVRASLALLALDALEPWGRACATPPSGDLRAPIGTLLGACDDVVRIGLSADIGRASELASGHGGDPPCEGRRVGASPGADAAGTEGPPRWGSVAGIDSAMAARVVSPGAWVGGHLESWAKLGGLRLGLLCALARPERVVRSLRGAGLPPDALRVVLCAPDHGPVARSLVTRAARAPVDLWLASAKCALHVQGRLPVAKIDHTLVLPDALEDKLAGLSPVP